MAGAARAARRRARRGPARRAAPARARARVRDRVRLRALRRRAVAGARLPDRLALGRVRDGRARPTCTATRRPSSSASASRCASCAKRPSTGSSCCPSRHERRVVACHSSAPRTRDAADERLVDARGRRPRARVRGDRRALPASAAAPCRRYLPEARAEDALQQALVAAWSGAAARRRGARAAAVAAPDRRTTRRSTRCGRPATTTSELRETLEGDGGPAEARRARAPSCARRSRGSRRCPSASARRCCRSPSRDARRTRWPRTSGCSHGAVRQLVHRARSSLRTAATALMPLPLAGRRPAALARRSRRARSAVAGAGGGATLAKAGAVAAVAERGGGAGRVERGSEARRGARPRRRGRRARRAGGVRRPRRRQSRRPRRGRRGASTDGATPRGRRTGAAAPAELADSDSDD